jgi:hypothetical protein
LYFEARFYAESIIRGLFSTAALLMWDYVFEQRAKNPAGFIFGPEKVQFSRLHICSGIILFAGRYRTSALRKGFFWGKALSFRFFRQFV